MFFLGGGGGIYLGGNLQKKIFKKRIKYLLICIVVTFLGVR